MPENPINFSLSLLADAPVTLGLAAVSLLLSLYAFFIAPGLYQTLILQPQRLRQKHTYYTLLTNAFLYGDLKFLTASLTMLLLSGMELEAQKGHAWFAVFFFVIILLSNLFIYFRHRDDAKYFKLSASSAIIGAVVYGLIVHPFARIGVPWLGFSFPATLAGLLYIGVLYWVISARLDNVSHEATLAGAVLGAIFAIFSLFNLA